jgi:hypothetical protein
VLSSLLGVLVSLSHETFFFGGFPCLLMIVFLGARIQGMSPRRALMVAAIFAIPTLISLGFAVSHRINAEIARTIWATFSEYDQIKISYGELGPLPGQAIREFAYPYGLGQSHGIATILNGYGGIWILYLLAAGAVMACWLRLADPLASLPPSQRRIRRATQAEFAFVLLIPTLVLFLVMDDWGRAIAYFSRNALIVWIITFGIADLRQVWPAHLAGTLLTRWAERVARFRVSLSLAVGCILIWAIFVGVPECCIGLRRPGLISAWYPAFQERQRQMIEEFENLPELRAPPVPPGDSLGPDAADSVTK